MIHSETVHESFMIWLCAVLGMDTNKQITEEINKLREEIRLLSEKKESDQGAGMIALIKYVTEERERTEKLLMTMAEKIRRMESRQQLGVQEHVPVQDNAKGKNFEEIALSDTDRRIIDFVQTKGMACADDIKGTMGYKGRNAACTRLKKLCDDGLLQRFQLGHKVYYRFDAGKATNTLIISPPQ